MEPRFPPHFLHMPGTPCGHGTHGLVSSGLPYNSKLEGGHEKALVSLLASLEVGSLFLGSI